MIRRRATSAASGAELHAISYLFFPRRILRTLRNVISGKGSATVFENRLQKAPSGAHP